MEAEPTECSVLNPKYLKNIESAGLKHPKVLKLVEINFS